MRIRAWGGRAARGGRSWGLDPSLDSTWAVRFPRHVSDGTLLDALRAALATGNAPEGLLAFGAEPDEEWEDELAAIEHPGLRAHPRLLLH